jgi:UPF0271 protein
MSKRDYLIDFNCDLGEGELVQRTRALMALITSANIACGGHAGDVDSMDTCVQLAKRHHVKLGAHPGFPDRKNFGRLEVQLTPNEFELLLVQQVSALEKIAGSQGVRLHHIKLHGGLYHTVENDPRLAQRYLRTVSRFWPGIRVYARSGGMVARLGRRVGARVWEEAFADRAYSSNGSLLPRGRKGAVFATAEQVFAQVANLLYCGFVIADGGRLRLRADTICLHADTPDAVRLARHVARVLREGD